jgi:hypothetical protein
VLAAHESEAPVKLLLQLSELLKSQLVALQSASTKP